MYKIFTEISPRFKNLGGQNPAEIPKSRRPKSCRDTEISAGKILPRFLNLGDQNPAEILKSRRPKSCRDSEISGGKILPRFQNLGGQNPAEILKSWRPKSCRESRRDSKISAAKILPRISLGFSKLSMIFLTCQKSSNFLHRMISGHGSSTLEKTRKESISMLSRPHLGSVYMEVGYSRWVRLPACPYNLSF